MIKKIKVRIETQQIGDNFDHGTEYLVKYDWGHGFTVEDKHGKDRYVPKGYAAEVIEIPSCPAGEVRGEKCDPCECEEEKKKR